ncbi:MAG: acyl-CoA dehydrogenase [Myxococcota bacterium]|jgi:butyryl-CoA dehydrogenase|nr:acyl-CoA dehydrogenase [Myxococcota bacterium]
MEFSLTSEQMMLRDTAREYARNELLPNAARFDAEGVFPGAQVKGMAELGLMGMMVDEAHGGVGMDVLSYALAMEEISAGCASCGVIMSVNNSLVCDPIETFGSQEQKQAWLPKLASGEQLGCFALSEPGTGSDAAAQTCKAVLEGDTWVINGEKNWITNGAEADVCVLIAMEDSSKGVKGINAYIVPTDMPGFVVAKNEKKLGIKASSTSQISLQDLRLPTDALLGERGKGFNVAMHTLDGGRIGIAAQALGIARQAYEEARDYSMERHAFGAPIGNLQAIQFMLADMATEIEAARLLIWQAAMLKEQKGNYGRASAMAKVYASEVSARVTHKAIQVFGGYGYSKEFPAERHFRDARITEIYEGTSEIQRLVIARSVLKEGI